MERMTPASHRFSGRFSAAHQRERWASEMTRSQGRNGHDRSPGQNHLAGGFRFPRTGTRQMMIGVARSGPSRHIVVADEPSSAIQTRGPVPR